MELIAPYQTKRAFKPQFFLHRPLGSNVCLRGNPRPEWLSDRHAFRTPARVQNRHSLSKENPRSLYRRHRTPPQTAGVAPEQEPDSPFDRIDLLRFHFVLVLADRQPLGHARRIREGHSINGTSRASSWSALLIFLRFTLAPASSD